MKNQDLVVQNSDLSEENLNQERNSDVVELQEEIQEIPQYCDLTQLLKSEPKEIIEHDTLNLQTQILFQNLGRTRLNSINICGPKGSGKTTIVENLAQKIIKKQCPKELKNTSVIQVKPDIFLPNDTAENIVYNLTLILIDLNNKGIKKVILFFDDFDQFPFEFLGMFESIKNAISQACDFELLKFIMIIPNDFFNIQDNYLLSFYKNSILFETNVLLDLELAQKITTPRVKELIKEHGEIEFSDEILERILLMIYSKSDCSTINLNSYLNSIDIACVICKQKNSKTFGEEEFEELFLSDFKTEKKTSKNKRYHTAYHEAGHCLLSFKFSEDEMELLGVKSIYDSCSGFAGTTLAIIKMSQMQCSKSDVKKVIAFYLAGRYAEKLLGCEPDMGAVSDLKKAMDIAKSFVYSSGTFKSLGKNCLYAVEDESTIISDETHRLVEEECKKLIKKATKYCKKVLKEDQEFLGILANTLYKKGLLSKKQIMELWDNYQKKRREESCKKNAQDLLNCYD